MTPDLGQGGGLAMEDAATLTALLRFGHDGGDRGTASASARRPWRGLAHRSRLCRNRPIRHVDHDRRRRFVRRGAEAQQRGGAHPCAGRHRRPLL
ncbi:MAG: hypothetical protein ACRDOY_11105 [Nocardioidaceae bacterium]